MLQERIENDNNWSFRDFQLLRVDGLFLEAVKTLRMGNLIRNRIRFLRPIDENPVFFGPIAVESEKMIGFFDFLFQQGYRQV